MSLTMAMPATAEGPGVVSLAMDESDAAAVIAKFKDKDPGLAKVFAESAGYVVFPTVAKGGLGVGGARGGGGWPKGSRPPAALSSPQHSWRRSERTSIH